MHATKDPLNIPQCCLLVAARCEAFYRAFSRSPSNPLVQRSLKVGFPFCKKLRFRTPLDVLKWYKQFQNSFGGPVMYTWMEYCNDVQTAEAMWLVHAKEFSQHVLLACA